LAPALCSPALTQPPNVLPNPSFELVEPPAPTVECPAPMEAPAEKWLPRTWNAWEEGGAVLTLPEDPAQAHSGRRCVHIIAEQGLGRVRHWPLVAPDGRTWTVRAWVRGKGKVRAEAWDVSRDQWKPIKSWPFDVPAEWGPIEFEFPRRRAAASGCSTWQQTARRKRGSTMRS